MHPSEYEKECSSGGLRSLSKLLGWGGKKTSSVERKKILFVRREAVGGRHFNENGCRHKSEDKRKTERGRSTVKVGEKGKIADGNVELHHLTRGGVEGENGDALVKTKKKWEA